MLVTPLRVLSLTLSPDSALWAGAQLAQIPWRKRSNGESGVADRAAKREGIPHPPLLTRSQEIKTSVLFGDRESQNECKEGMGWLGRRKAT